MSKNSLVAQVVRNLPAKRETWVWSLGWEYPLEKERLPTPVFRPGEFHGLCAPWGRKESTWLSAFHFFHNVNSMELEKCCSSYFLYIVAKIYNDLTCMFTCLLFLSPNRMQDLWQQATCHLVCCCIHNMQPSSWYTVKGLKEQINKWLFFLRTLRPCSKSWKGHGSQCLDGTSMFSNSLKRQRCKEARCACRVGEGDRLTFNLIPICLFCFF